MKEVLTYKSTIFSLANVISVYCLSKGYIDMDTATLISGIILALWGSINVTQNNLLNKKNK